MFTPQGRRLTRKLVRNANKKFKRNAPLYRNRQSAINKTKRDIKKDPNLNKAMKKLKEQKNID